MEEHGVKFLQVMHMYVCSYDIKYVKKKAHNYRRVL